MDPPQQKPAASAASKGNTTTTKKTRKPRYKQAEHKYPVEPRIIQVLKKPKSYMDHSYRDFSNVPIEVDYTQPTEIEEMSFSQKVHHILSQDEYANWIHWLPHGRAFKIAVPKRLEQAKVLQKYFGHNRFSSFLRQLSNFGFKHITSGVDRNCYYHECMLRGLPHLTKYMPAGRDSRRLIPDPANEPDFYAISRSFPIPDSASSSPPSRPPEPAQVCQEPVAGSTATTSTSTAITAIPSLALAASVAPSGSNNVTEGSLVSNVLKQAALSMISTQVQPVDPLQQQQQQQQQLAAAALLRSSTTPSTGLGGWSTCPSSSSVPSASTTPQDLQQQLLLAVALKNKQQQQDPSASSLSSRYLSLLQGNPSPSTALQAAMTLQQVQQQQAQQQQQQQPSSSSAAAASQLSSTDPAVLAALLGATTSATNSNPSSSSGGFSSSSGSSPFGNLFQR